jgi:hypothetical protein
LPRTFTIPDDATSYCDFLATLPGVAEIPTPAAVPPPTQDAVALALIQGMLSGGRYGDDPAAVIESAWAVVGAYYLGRQAFIEKYEQLYFPELGGGFYVTVDDLPDAPVEPEALGV